MHRLLMGEVGSGKTVVALYAMLRVAEDRHAGRPDGAHGDARRAALRDDPQADRGRAVRRPRRQLDWARRSGLLTGSTPARERTEVLERLRTGELRLLVGTHALIQEAVEFDRLALAVVDEQHRFGVRQRAALDGKARGELAPHLLHLTATPIPRTLSLTLYGDLDTTVLRELPSGRQPVKTWVVPEHKREGAYDFIRARLTEGQQCFVVCPLVEESEALQARAATVEGGVWRPGSCATSRSAVMHGQMHAREKRAVMARFVSGEVDVLVATSVIEVGIDVPNASVMVIEEADRYGISQLHQLRGRVGRGAHESVCLLFSDARSELARHRLEAVAAERDGFRLAEVDLTLRGEGDVLGTRQHGLPEFRVARLPEDAELLELARAESIALLAVRSRARQPRARAAAHACSSAASGRSRSSRSRPEAGRRAGRRRRIRGPAPRGAPRRPDETDAPARARGAVQHPRAAGGAAGARPLRRLRGARDRGALAWRIGGDVRRLRRRGGAGGAREPRADRVGRGRVFRADALSFLRGAARHGESWDLVLCDPPYRLAHRLGPALGPLLAPVLGTEARIVCESSPKHPLRLDLPVIDERRYGDTALVIHGAAA